MENKSEKIVQFKVNEGLEPPFIVVEPIHPSEEYHFKGFLALTLPSKTSVEKAKEICKYLNENIVDISHTHKDLQ
jgi:hypothetical protein